MKVQELNKKIPDDFVGDREHWGQEMQRWVFVHNDRRGLPALAVKKLNYLRRKNSKIKIETWSEPEFLIMKEGLGLGDLEALFGYAPTGSSADSLRMDDLQPVIDAL